VGTGCGPAIRTRVSRSTSRLEHLLQGEDLVLDDLEAHPDQGADDQTGGRSEPSRLDAGGVITFG
jgi:hypothetical protein